MQSQLPFVYVLTLQWNNPSDTIVFLRSCSELTYPNYRVLVIDNGSTISSIDHIHEQFPEIEIITSPINHGFAGGMNIGIQHACQQDAEFLFIVNNDTLFSPDILDQLIQAAGKNNIDIASPAIYYMNPADKIWSLGGLCSNINLEVLQRNLRMDVSQLDEPFRVDFVTGCGMLLSRKCVDKIGAFDERFFMYYEDFDYCLRARSSGLKIMVVPRARMWHRVAGSIGGIYSPPERYHMARASVQFFKKHGTGWRRAVIIPYRTASAIKTLIKLVLLGQNSSARAYVRGLIDGLRM